MKSEMFYGLLAQKLYYLRKVTGRTQEQVARYCEIDRSTYSYYELGRVRPNLYTLFKLAKWYHVSVDYLLSAGDFSADKQFSYRFQYRVRKKSTDSAQIDAE